ncbi:unnamed protein product [marine sediment metagenome]|uniref:Uncharacterized protein n=1 Tax=marine sediment metagenome TaxID=412755 RepID=X1PG50_9ZZZZ
MKLGKKIKKLKKEIFRDLKDIKKNIRADFFALSRGGLNYINPKIDSLDELVTELKSLN